MIGTRCSGLRTGSPPSPPPHLIRPTVRLLLRSPRLSGPGPHRRPASKRRHGPRARSGRNNFHLGKLLEFGQDVVVMLREIAHHPCVAEQLAEITIAQHKIEMIGAV